MLNPYKSGPHAKHPYFSVTLRHQLPWANSLDYFVFLSQKFILMQRSSASCNNFPDLENNTGRVERVIKYSPKSKRCFQICHEKRNSIPTPNRSYDRHAFPQRPPSGTVQAGRFTIRRQPREAPDEDDLLFPFVKPIVCSVTRRREDPVLDWCEIEAGKPQHR